MFVLGLVGSPRVMKMFSESKADIAKATVRKYAYEAYPSWAEEHVDAICPRSLTDLNEYMNNKDTLDPWGHPYFFTCGVMVVPAGVRGVWVTSAGEDGSFGTRDDVRSDQ
jgi:hypothetical protein